MHRVVLASVVVLAADTGACGNVHGARPSIAMSIVGPTNLGRPNAATFAKGGNGSGNGNSNGNGPAADSSSSPSSLTLAAVVTDVNSDGGPNYGDAVTFAV